MVDTGSCDLKSNSPHQYEIIWYKRSWTTFFTYSNILIVASYWGIYSNLEFIASLLVVCACLWPLFPQLLFASEGFHPLLFYSLNSRSWVHADPLFSNICLHQVIYRWVSLPIDEAGKIACETHWRIIHPYPKVRSGSYWRDNGVVIS